mmetsp:Transcript_6179/g.17280  ORF Transcript_6179/g.17280 Transcript_6179/m.17280 type:complete len:237 (-) Transcript_6179:120-830(-)
MSHRRHRTHFCLCFPTHYQSWWTPSRSCCLHAICHHCRRKPPPPHQQDANRYSYDAPTHWTPTVPGPNSAVGGTGTARHRPTRSARPPADTWPPIPHAALPPLPISLRNPYSMTCLWPIGEKPLSWQLWLQPRRWWPNPSDEGRPLPPFPLPPHAHHQYPDSTAVRSARARARLSPPCRPRLSFYLPTVHRHRTRHAYAAAHDEDDEEGRDRRHTDSTASPPLRRWPPPPPGFHPR